MARRGPHRRGRLPRRRPLVSARPAAHLSKIPSTFGVRSATGCFTSLSNQLLLAVENALLRDADHFRVVRNAAPDVARHAIRLGALAMDDAGNIRVEAGGTLEDVVGWVRASVPTYFYDDAPPAAAPVAWKPPAIAKLSASERLAQANGEPPLRPQVRRDDR